MNKFILAIVLFSAILVYAESESSQPTKITLLFQTLTLLPEKIAKLDLPDTVENRRGHIEISVKIDRKVNVLPSKHRTDSHVLFDREEIAKFQAFIFTNRGRALGARATDQGYLGKVENQHDNQIIFIADLALGNKESVNAIGFVCDKKVTILEVVWLDRFSR